MTAQMFSQQWKAQLEQELAQASASPTFVHNQDLHERIVASWKQESPVMWRRLQTAGAGGLLARVLQQRMWTERDRLISSGMPAPDAREQAERDHLMLEPEAETAQEPELMPAM